jgi:hypothetical protein
MMLSTYPLPTVKDLKEFEGTLKLFSDQHGEIEWAEVI